MTKISSFLITLALLAIGAGLGYMLYQYGSDNGDLAKSREQELSQLRNEISEKASQLEAKQQRMAELQEQLQESRSKVDALREALKESQTELTHIRAQADSQREAGGSVNGDGKTLSEMCSALSSEFKEDISKGEATVNQRGQELSMTFVDRVLFDFASASLTEEGERILERAGKILKDSGEMRVRIVGHADNVPIALEFRRFYPTNWELSAARAASVVSYLQKKVDIDPTRMEAVGKSYFQPVAGNENEEGRSKNRRVEIVIAPPYRLIASGEAS